MADEVPSHAPEAGAALGRGATIGRYVVLAPVGHGAMGDVYAAYDPELDRKVAVKVLRARASPSGDESEGRARALREAQAIARLSHPNVIVVYDVGAFEERVFLAMEFIDGETLSAWRRARPLRWRETLRVFKAAGRGLAAAHAAGLIHRDFKPDNVMVDRDGQVRVMDFGLARWATPASPSVAPASPPSHEAAADVDLDATRIIVPVAAPVVAPAPAAGAGAPVEADLTPTGAVLGTPAYMAPEQLVSRSADPRSDQFSFCVALYETLYGQRPFEGATLLALTTAVMAGQVRAPPAGSKVPSWLRRVLLRGLSAAPDRRHSTMAALLAALDKDPGVARRRWGVRAGAAVLVVGLALGLGQRLQARRSLCRGGGAKLAGIWEPSGVFSPRKEAIRAAFSAGEGGYGRQAFEAVRQILDRYATNWTVTYQQACEATALRREQSPEVLDLRMSCLRGRLDSLRALTDVFIQADRPVVEKAAGAAQSLAPLERCSDLAILRAVVKPPDDPAVNAHATQLRKRLAEVKALADAGRRSEALTLARPLAVDARALGYLPVVAEALMRLGCVAAGRPNEAEAILDEAIWAAVASGDQELVAEAAVVQVMTAGFLAGHPEKAGIWIRMADATLNRIGGHDILRSWLLNNEGAVFFAQSRYEEALAKLRTAAAFKEKILGPDDPDFALSLGNMAEPLAKLGRYEEALAISERAIAILEKNHSTAPYLAPCLSSQADYLRVLGRYADAEAVAKRSIAITEGRFDQDDVFFGSPWTVLGRVYLLEGRPKAAVPYLERAYELRRRLDPDPSRLGETAFALAQALWRSSRADHPRALALAVEAEHAYAKTAEIQPLTTIRAWLEGQNHLVWEP